MKNKWIYLMSVWVAATQFCGGNGWATDDLNVNPADVASIRKWVRAYQSDQLDQFREPQSNVEGPNQLPKSLIYYLRDQNGTQEGQVSAVWGLSQITQKFLRKTVEYPRDEAFERPAIDRLIHAYLSDSYQKFNGGVIFHTLKLAAQSPRPQVAASAMQEIQGLATLLVQIALEQGDFSETTTQSTDHIDFAVNMLAYLAEPLHSNTTKSTQELEVEASLRRLASKSLLEISNGTPGRAEPTEERRFTYSRQELAHLYSRRALVELASKFDSKAAAEVCAHLLAK